MSQSLRAGSGLTTFGAMLLGYTAGTGVAPVMAATTAADAADPEVQEIVVTARKREEKLLDVPAPVSALSSETLELTKATRLEDYLTQLPGVTFDQSRAGQTKVTFRGLNAGDVNATVVTYVDNVPLTFSGAHASSAYLTPNLDSSDLAQIEVDRGPQGTLYGANAIGGVLKYVTIKPDPNNFSGRVEVGGESLSHGGTGGNVRGAVNIPLVADKLALRVSAYNRLDPGFIDDPALKMDNVNGGHVSGGRAALLWNATDALAVTLSAMVQNMRTNGSDYMDYNPFTRQPLYGDLTHERALRNEWFSARYAVYNADIQWDLQWAKLLSSSSYSRMNNGGDTDLTPAYGPLLGAITGYPNSGADNPLVVHGHQFTEELRLTSEGTNVLDWQVSAFYADSQTRYDQGLNLFDTVTQNFVSDFGSLFDGYHSNKYIERSLFGNVDYHLTSQFDVGLGVRYSEDQQVLHSFFEGLIFGPTVQANASEKEHAFTWMVNPRYKITDDQMVYARVATGYRPGGVSLLTPAALAAGLTPIFKPDKVTSYEAGWKGAFFEHRVTLDLSAYYIRWTDLQEAVTLGSFSFLSNGGKAHSQGLEAALTWAPLYGLSVGGSLTYNTNRLDEDAQNNPDLSQAGNRLPGTPKLSGNLTADYKWDLTGKLRAFVGASAFFTTARPNALAIGFDPNRASGAGPIPNFNTVPIYDPNTNEVLGYTSNALAGYTTVDLRAGLEQSGWTLQAYVKNVGDRRAYSQIGGLNDPNYANFSTQWTGVVLRPRTVGLSLAWKF